MVKRYPGGHLCWKSKIATPAGHGCRRNAGILFPAFFEPEWQGFQSKKKNWSVLSARGAGESEHDPPGGERSFCDS